MKTTQKPQKANKCNALKRQSQSYDRYLMEHAFNLLKTKLKTKRPTKKQQLKAAEVKARQSISNEEISFYP